tara:strand:+ start:1039 stop:1542 length:504 start_codon:yes stop_codon:yes gene_type:complete
MATTINADTSDGLKLTADTSGEIEFQSVGVTKAGVNATGLTGDGSQLTALPAPDALSTASGSAPSYSARAWVNFNGTGTVAIRASGNVSSITDNGTGDYTVNFTTAMADANYSPVVTLYSDKTGAGVFGLIGGINALATGSFQIDTIASASSFAYFDTLLVTVAVFR